MFAWGSCIDGELALDSEEEEECVPTPRVLDWYLAGKVIQCALGDNHTIFLTKDGKVYSAGNNDYGQLGHKQPRKRPQAVTNLDVYNITHVACGAAHSLALSQWGQVFSWGSDYYGQLGQQLGENTVQSSPKIVKSLASYHIVQLVCGQRHTVALSNNGDILAWGANNFGQLGLGLFSERETVPKIITSLKGIPIASIACGANHTFALSKSGAVYAWGKNTKGQLGLNDSNNRMFPTQLRTMRNLKVKYIACGEEFSVFLTLDGGVFTCGSGMYGQLGHGSNYNEIVPKQVIELMGSTITQVACGRQHCLVLIPLSIGRVYSFGMGSCGQLGISNVATGANTPQAIMGPWLSKDDNAPNLCVRRIFAGGDHCFVTVTTEDKKSIPPYDCRNYSSDTQILTITQSFIKTLIRTPAGGPVNQEVLIIVEAVFKSSACLNGSFLTDNDEHYSCSSRHHGVDIECAESAFDLIAKIENESLKDVIWTGLTESVLKQLTPNPPDVETLRIYLTLPLYHEFNNPKHYLKLHIPYIAATMGLGTTAIKVLSNWWISKSPVDYFERLVNVFKNVVGYILRNQKIPSNRIAFYDKNLLTVLEMMAFLHGLNQQVDGLKVPYDIFYLNDLHDYLDVRLDYYTWLSEHDTSGKVLLCNYPFLFDASAKLNLLETDQLLQMRNAIECAAQHAFLQAVFSQSPVVLNQFLMLNIDRANIVEDTLKQLNSLGPNDLKKPLKIKFKDEEAEDAGGVTKEFFLLVLREILDPKYGLFKEYEETNNIWFSDCSFEDDNVYFLIGMIFGLAIYNFTIVDVPFPLALYKKLLEEPVTLNDLKDLSPTIFKSLKTLLDYENDDIQDVFCLSFDITRDVWGEVVVTELKPNGSNIPVTLENKKEYVSLYVDYIFNKSVKSPYDVFHSGFMKVCGGRVMKLFHSHELMEIVIGNENYDWHILEEVAEYKNGYTSGDETIRFFWEVIHEMSLEDKKKFLLFLTGSNRIPIKGMRSIKIIIQPTYDDKFLPVAHTCFNLLDLPRYKTKERLRYKLMQAIQQTEGFSLV